MREPILVSIPHGGWKVAEEIKEVWALSEKDAFHDGDPLTARIFDFQDRVTAQLTMEYYRAVVDLNRAPDDIAPGNPDGVIKSHTCHNVEVYKPGCLPDDNLKLKLLDRYYHPYHRRLASCLSRDDIRMGIDCHSMEAVSPPIEGRVGKPRPLICLSNLGDENGAASPPGNRITCPPEMIRYMRDELVKVFRHEDVGMEIPSICTMNVPFQGGYITMQMGNKGIPFVQLELSRALYLTPQHFDEVNLIADDRRIQDLDGKVWKVLKSTASYL
jgi:N-formylglutamate deformylase